MWKVDVRCSDCGLESEGRWEGEFGGSLACPKDWSGFGSSFHTGASVTHSVHCPECSEKLREIGAKSHGAWNWVAQRFQGLLHQ